MMKNILFKTSIIILILTDMLLLSVNAMAQPMVVIVNANNTEIISREMIKQIYSDQRTSWKTGHDILLFELPVKDKGREIFAEALLNKSAMASQADWSNRYVKNTIKNNVKMKPQKLVAKFVSRHDHAIGYIPLSIAQKQKNIKVIMTIDE